MVAKDEAVREYSPAIGRTLAQARWPGYGQKQTNPAIRVSTVEQSGKLRCHAIRAVDSWRDEEVEKILDR